MTSIGAALLILFQTSTSAAPPPIEPPPTQRLDVSPRFLSQPNIQDLFPARALKEAVSGVARIQCVSTREGGTRDCRVIEETPLGWGFGQAGLDGMARSRLQPGQVDGQPVDSRVVQPFTFIAVGEVELDCAVDPDQNVSDCRIAKEVPSGRCLGARALRQAKTESPDRWDLARARNGRFAWRMDVHAPLADSPERTGQPGCMQPPG
ncbi:energy transducer TonB [Brevundimonas faecalis]|uniref:energy transducer TonB n=1 Tax=Brevundimonas faecalis TaxID=947378 RepID=UPI00339A1FE0